MPRGQLGAIESVQPGTETDRNLVTKSNTESSRPAGVPADPVWTLCTPTRHATRPDDLMIWLSGTAGAGAGGQEVPLVSRTSLCS